MANKGVKIFLIVILTVIAIILINFMVVKIANKDYKVAFFSIGNKTEKIFEEEYDINEIKNINVSASSSNVKFIEGSQEKVKVTAYGSKDESINAKLDGDTLDIKKENKVIHIFMLFAWYKEEIIVELPKDFEGNIKTVVSSGSIEVMDLDNTNLTLGATSGSIHCGNMKNGDIKTSSGNIYVGSGNEVNLRATSGGIKAENINKGTVNTTSGSIKIETLEKGEVKASSGSVLIGKLGEGNINTTSGAIRLEELGIGEVKATSGGIKIGKANKITAISTSGSINIDTIDGFCNLSTKSGGVKIENLSINENSNIETTSGGVRILSAVGDMYVDTKTKSGAVNVNNSNRKSDIELKIQTTSGGIKVENK